MDRADTERLFDSEYFLDLRSFSWPRAWDDSWRSATVSTGAFRVSGASLDCCDLLLDQGLVFVRRLSPRTEFRFRFEQYDDKDRQEYHHWLEFETGLGGGWSAELFGEPAFRKEDADLGFGVRWRRAGRQLRLRRNLVDWNFNARGSSEQRDSLKPRTSQVQLDWPAGPGDVRLTGEFDEPSRREDPAARRSFGYRRELMGAGWQGDGDWSPRVVYAYERQERLDRFAPGLGTSADFRRRVHQATASARVKRGDGIELEPGLSAFVRSAQNDDPFSPDAGVSYKRWELQPWLRWRKRWTERYLWELSPFLTAGQNRVRTTPSTRAPTVVEAKLDTALELRWSDSSKLGFNLTWDLDTPGKPWDGGNVRAMFLF